MERRMRELSEENPRYGYRRIAALLRREGWAAGKRQIQRLRRAAGLRVPPSKRKIVRRGVSTGLPTQAAHRGHVWTWDFIADATVRGGALRMLTILDEHTRECHVLRADRALRSQDVLEWLGKAIEEHGAPQYLRSDIRPTAIGKKNWLFIGAGEAGERSAIIYTIIECCRRRGLDPFAYLRDVFTRLPSMTNWQVKDLTPEAWAKAQQQADLRAIA